MKKILRFFLILIVLVLAAMFILPIVFKSKIEEAVKSAANESLTAVLDFDAVELSLFRDFPNLSVSITQLSLTGTETFEGLPLIRTEELRATVDLGSLFGEEISVREIALVRPEVNVRVLASGEANYDIVKSAGETVEEDTSGSDTGSGFKMNLAAYSISDGSIVYDDASFPMKMELRGFSHSGSGDFTSERFVLLTESEIAQASFVYDGVRYLRDASAKLKAEFDIDMATSTYTFKENELLINQMPLHADGWVAMPGEDIDMDIRFSSTGSELTTLLSMVPAEFASDLSGVSTSGQVNFDGFVRGTYNETTMPGLALNLSVKNGRVSYPDLPKSIENIDIAMRLDASEGIDKDALTLDIDRFYLEMAENPIDLRLHLKNPYTDPYIDAGILAKVNFAGLSEVLPLEKGDELSGSINSDLSFKGRMSALEEERYEDFEAKGQLVALGILMKSDSLPYDIQLTSAYFTFTPRFAELSNFEALIGNSDLQANGRIDNYMQYALQDSLLKGSFSVRSKLLDLNKLMASTEEEGSADTSEVEEPEEAMEVIQLPGNIDFTLNADFKEMRYEEILITNVTGALVLRDKVAYLDGLSMRLLDGQVSMSGSYDTRESLPLMDMEFGIKDMDIRKSAEAFYTIDKLAPIAKSCQGKFSTSLAMKAQLDEKMEPVESTITGGGILETKQVNIEKFEPLNKLAAELGIDRLAKQRINDVRLTYRFENGKVIVDPFTVELEGIETSIDGSMSFSQELDYNVKMIVPSDKLPGNLAAQGSQLLNDLNSRFGSNLSVGTKIPVSLKITGTVEDPKVSGNYGEQIKEQGQELKEQVKEEIKEAVEEKVDEAREAAIAKAREEAAEIIAKAQEQADALMATARKNADQAKSAAYAEAQKVEDSAKNPLEKMAKKAAADKLRQEADKAHQKALSEAQKSADNLISNAEKRAEEKIAAAEKQD